MYLISRFLVLMVLSCFVAPVVAGEKDDSSRITEHLRTLSEDDQRALLEGMRALVEQLQDSPQLRNIEKADHAKSVLIACMQQRVNARQGLVVNTSDGLHLDVSVHNALSVPIHGILVEVTSPQIPEDVTAPVDLLFGKPVSANSGIQHRESGPWSPDMPESFEVKIEVVDILDAAGAPIIRTPFDEHFLGMPPQEKLRRLSQIFCHGQAPDR